MGQGHGWEGTALKLLRGKDFEFTVTGAEDITSAGNSPSRDNG